MNFVKRLLCLEACSLSLVGESLKHFSPIQLRLLCAFDSYVALRAGGHETTLNCASRSQFVIVSACPLTRSAAKSSPSCRANSVSTQSVPNLLHLALKKATSRLWEAAAGKHTEIKLTQFWGNPLRDTSFHICCDRFGQAYANAFCRPEASVHWNLREESGFC